MRRRSALCSTPVWPVMGGSALDRIDDLADAGRDMGQVAQQLETEARRRLLAAATDPVLARRLAGMLRAASEAGTAVLVKGAPVLPSSCSPSRRPARSP